MESWLAMVVSLFIAVLVRSIFMSRNPNSNKSLPPGPKTFPIIGTISWLLKSSTEIEQILRNLHRKYGPVISLRIRRRPLVFVADRTLAHQALVQHGAVFADRPPALLTNSILSSNQHNISSAAYGPTWRLLRRNLTSHILHPSRINSFSNARRWVLHLLLHRLTAVTNTAHDDVDVDVDHTIVVVEHFQYAMFCLLVLMCFGDKLPEPKIKEIETVQRRLLLNLRRFNILNFWPQITKILLRNRWQEFFQLHQNQKAVLIPLIEARRNNNNNNDVVCYVDTLLDLNLPLPAEKDKDKTRKLDIGEMVSLCSEFLNGGTDTTSTALQWIMANIVKYPHVQDKLYAEINHITRQKHEQVEGVVEDDLQNMPYLKAVVLEGLRRHPPGHFVLPHAITEDEVVLGGHVLPKDATINFMVADMAWDPNVWEDPMEFKPERFLGAGGSLSHSPVDLLTGNKEIKMMPFGAGRRICPGYGLAILHLEYFVANLVWRFHWKPVDGDEVDLSEKQEFTTVMKYPLKARLSPRSHNFN